MLARPALRPSLGCQRNNHSCSSQGRLLCGAVAPPPVRSVHARQQTQASRWRCSSVADSSRPVPSEEQPPSSDTPEAQAALPFSTSEDTAAVEKRRKGIALLEELKELVKSSNAELKAELLQQFALLQQTESEAKRQSDDDRALVLHMYQAVSQQLDDIRAQLHRRDREDGSTAATLGQVLGVVRSNSSILGEVQAVQKRVDTRTAQAVHHAKAAAASAAAAQQQQGALAEGIKAHVTSAKDAVLASNRDTAGKVTSSSSKAAMEALVKAAVDQAQKEHKQAAQKKLTVQQLACLAEVYDNHGLKRGRRKRAVRVSAEAISKHEKAYDIAKHIQDVFDDAYGKYWNCVVAPKGSGDSVGVRMWVTNKQYIHLGVGEWMVELWLSQEDDQQDGYGWHNGNRGDDSDYDYDDAVYDDDD